MQPLDDGCFRSFKAQWRKEVSEWACMTNGASVQRTSVAKMVGDVIAKCWSPNIVIGSWTSTGLWPIIRAKALEKPVPSNSHSSPTKYSDYVLTEDPLPLSNIKPRDIRRMANDGIDPRAYRAFSIAKRTIGESPPKHQQDRVLIELKAKRLLTQDDCIAELRLRKREREVEERIRKEKKEAATEMVDRERLLKHKQVLRMEKKQTQAAARAAKEQLAEMKRRKRHEKSTEKQAAAALKTLAHGATAQTSTPVSTQPSIVTIPEPQRMLFTAREFVDL
jgi:hypothetical protein